MSNRLCDTEIWKKDWYLDLSTKQKLLVKFLFDNCDCAGFYKISWHLLRLCFNDCEITLDDFKKIKQVKFISDDFIFIEDFALFQCKVKSFNDLNLKNNAHKGVLKLLEKYNIFKAPSEPLVSPFKGAQEKDKEKEKEKEKDIIFNIDIEKCFKLYSENCINLLPLTFEKRSRNILEELNEFLKEIDYDFEYFLSLCKKANSLEKIVKNKIDFRSMIRNHIGIMNGKYENDNSDVSNIIDAWVKGG